MTNDGSRRAHDRLEISLDIILRYQDQEISGRCLNISQGGMFVETEPIKMGEMVTLVFKLPDISRPIETDARVCWTERDNRRGIGVQFMGLRPIEVWAINQLFIRRNRKEI